MAILEENEKHICMTKEKSYGYENEFREDPKKYLGTMRMNENCVFATTKLHFCVS